jgi:hypothetical protein
LKETSVLSESYYRAYRMASEGHSKPEMVQMLSTDASRTMPTCTGLRPPTLIHIRGGCLSQDRPPPGRKQTIPVQVLRLVSICTDLQFSGADHQMNSQSPAMAFEIKVFHPITDGM